VGETSTLQIRASSATKVTIAGSDGSSYTLPSPTGGTQAVTPSQTTKYTVTAIGPGGTASATATVTVTSGPTTSVSITANPTTIVAGNASTLTIVASNATMVTVAGSDGSSYNLNATGGTQSVSPSANTTYTATANGASGTATAKVSVTVTTEASVKSIDHVILMLQENRSFDSYFGMLNPYRKANNWTVASDGTPTAVDGIDDKLTKITNSSDEGTAYTLFKTKSTCLDDMSSAWLESFGDVSRFNFSLARGINMDGFVHTAEGFAKNCAIPGACSGSYTDTAGKRAMAYYDESFLNYYYFMASQFAISDRWFSPVASKSIPNRIATFTGGTTQGLVFDPGLDDKLPQLNIPTIFQELDNAKVSWKIYYTVTLDLCLASNPCSNSPSGNYPATTFSLLSYSYQYLYSNTGGAACTGTTKPSSTVGDPTNSFCIDTNHIAPVSQFITDMKNGTLPSFAFIESGSGVNDEHPGSGQSILVGQAQVAGLLNTFMASPSWKDSVFFLTYDEGGGPYDHVPPVPGHSNDFTNASLGKIPDISAITVNADTYMPCVPSGGTPTLHCDLRADDPGAQPTDAAAVKGFASQIGFRIPNMIVSPFVKAHYVSHIPMDHTAVIKFVETRFIGGTAHLTARDAAQPNLLDLFDFTNVPWAIPPTPPAPVSSSSLGSDPCTPDSMGP
jgi:phospholipase C